MKSVFFITLAGSALFMLFGAAALSRPKMSVRLDDSVYALREPIWIVSTLRNDSSVLLHCGVFKYGVNLKMRLSNSAGDTFSYRGIIIDYAKPREQTLGLGEGLQERGNLLDYYGVTDHGSRMNFLPIGEYSLSVYLDLGQGRMFLSDPVTFKIVEPAGPDRVQHDSLVEARKALGERNWTRCEQIYDWLIDKYPDGQYSDLALYESATVARFRSVEVYESKMIRLFNSYKESILAEEMLPPFVKYLTSRKRDDEAVKLLRDLNDRYPAMRIGRAAKFALDSL